MEVSIDDCHATANEDIRTKHDSLGANQRRVGKVTVIAYLDNGFALRRQSCSPQCDMISNEKSGLSSRKETLETKAGVNNRVVSDRNISRNASVEPITGDLLARHQRV
jgi:hypothetical protein